MAAETGRDLILMTIAVVLAAFIHNWLGLAGVQ